MIQDRSYLKTKKRLLVFTSTFPRWTNDTKSPFVFELSKRLRKIFNVVVLAPHYPGAKRHELFGGLTVYRFKYTLNRFQKLAGDEGILAAINHNRLLYFLIPFFLFFELIALFKTVKKFNPDLIHAHWVIPQGFMAFLSWWLLKIPYVVTAHGSDIFGIEGFRFIKKLCLKNAACISVVSNEIRYKILREYGPDLIIHTIPMGIDTKIFRTDQKDNRIIEKYQITRPFLLFVGRIAPEKGLIYLVQAMARLIVKYPNAKLLIVGGGSDHKKLELKIKKMNLSKHIIFAGKISNRKLPAYYATADVFVSPSLREGSPVSYIESLACGTPIVVGDLPICRELVGSNRGLTAIQNDPGNIARKIECILKSKKMVEYELHEYVRKHFDWNIITKRYSKILNAALHSIPPKNK